VVVKLKKLLFCEILLQCESAVSMWIYSFTVSTQIWTDQYW